MISLDVEVPKQIERSCPTQIVIDYLSIFFGISISYNPSIMHQNPSSSPVSERTRIKTREPSMSGPTSEASKKIMENHRKNLPFPASFDHQLHLQKSDTEIRASPNSWRGMEGPGDLITLITLIH